MLKKLGRSLLAMKLFKNNFRTFNTRTSGTFSFKNKINLFYKHVHPDILGSTCPNEYRKINESSVQDLNNYIESLGKMNSKFQNKLIDFYIKIEDLDEDSNKSGISFSKLTINLEKIEPSTLDSNKISLQLK
jgi:hypothetical protein